MGANEIKATVGSNGEIRFDNLAHIDSLDPTDLLSIRLYLNHDAANTLWEWAFTRNGLHVYYEVPGNTQEKSKRSLPKISDVNCGENTCSDIEILSILAPGDEGYKEVESPMAQPEAKVRTLGGMRLRFRYIPPSLDGLKVTKITWKMGYKGRYCNRYGVDAVACETKEANDTYEQKQPSIPMMPNTTGDWSVYWEPLNSNDEVDWSNWAGTQTTDAGVSSSLKAEYTLPAWSSGPEGNVSPIETTKYFEQKFTLNTRELKPATGTEEPMKGSDVAMLEAMLWQLGVSPQKGRDYQYNAYAGIEGNRIYSDRGKDKENNPRGFTENCDGTDKTARDIFSAGWSTCDVGKVAVEGMVRRFQGRHISAKEAGKFSRSGGKDSSGIVDNQTLKDLGDRWGAYYQVYSKYRNTPTLLAVDYVNPNDKTQVLIPKHPGADAWLTSAADLWQNGFNADVPATYTQAIHEAVLELAGLDKAAKSQLDLLVAWKAREADSHWGSLKGRPFTAFRMTEGGGDELGSMSYNQVQFHFRYSREPYEVHKNAGLNYFDPADNLKGFIIHTSAKPTTADATGLNHPGPFYLAFNTSGQIKAHGTNGPKGYKNCTGSTCGAFKSLSATDDKYELLAKGIAMYNSSVPGQSWPTILKNRPKGSCRPCEYSIDVRNSTDKFGLPYRQYIWKGGVEPDEIPVIGADGSPEMNENGSTKMQANPKAGQDWCFAYGEREWMSSKIWEDVKNDAESADAIGNYKTPIGRVNCQ